MTEQKTEKLKANETEKSEKRQKQKERLILKLAKIRSEETKAARKERARDLIKVGSIVSQYHDIKELIKYLEKPKFVIVIDEKTSVSDEKPENENVKKAIFLSPKIAPKK